MKITLKELLKWLFYGILLGGIAYGISKMMQPKKYIEPEIINDNY